MKRREIQYRCKYRICTRKTIFIINDIVEVEHAMAKGGFYVSCGKLKGYVKSSDLAEF